MAGAWKIGGSTADRVSPRSRRTPGPICQPQDGRDHGSRPSPGSIFGRRVRALRVTIRPLMHIERINTDEGLEALVPEWAALWQRVPHATPFQSPLWLTAWWRQFGTGMPRIVIAHAGGRLIGVLPLYELREPECVKLLPLGISVSDYIDALCDPAYPRVADALLAAILDIPGWQECHLPDLPADAALASAAAPSELTETRHSGPPCPVLTLSQDDVGLAAIVPHKTLRDVRQARTRSEAIGDVAIETADLATLDAALGDL